MKTEPNIRRPQNGSALVVAVFVVALVGVLIGLAFDYTTSTAKITRRAADYSTAQGLGNGALEVAFKRWQKYMAAQQASGVPKVQDPAHYTSAQSLAALTPALLSGINSSNTIGAYSVTALTIVPVDRADRPAISQAQSLTSTGPLNGVPGWTATTTTYCATATVAKNYNASTKTADLTVTVSRYFQQADASLYQAMLFFDDDLELHAGPQMTLYGLVHSNARIFAAAGSGGSLTFQSNVSYSGTSGSGPLDPAVTKSQTAANYNVKDTNFNGYIEGVTKTLYNQESPTWNNYNVPLFPNGGVTQQVSQVDKLSPIGDNDPGTIDPKNPNASGDHEIVERPAPVSASNPNPNTAYTDPDAFKAHRVFASAGLRVIINRNAKGGTQPIRVYRMDPGANNADASNNSIEVTPNYTKTGALATGSDGNVANGIIQAITLASGSSQGEFTDLREGRPINVSTVDMSALTPVLSASSYNNGVFYITDATNADASGNTGNSDAIRLRKGGTLPANGLTVATDGAIYVQGDYNTGTTYAPDVNGQVVPLVQPPSNLAAGSDPTKYIVTGYAQPPAAVMGDAVMILSNSWQDANYNAAIDKRLASSTTFNAALVSGQVLTTDSAASGGAHNFPRFLENWGSKNFTYHGSMIELYASTHFTGKYQTGSVYSPPTRRWYFDDSFIQNPPPGNLRSTTYRRGRWIRTGSS